MLPRPTPETIADAISMVLSGERVRAFFAHSRERRTRESNFQALPPKRRWVACAGTSGRRPNRPSESCGLELPHVVDRLVRHVGGEVVARLPDPRKDLGVITEQIGLPLVGLAAHKP
jgi:hypothetical protein